MSGLKVISKHEKIFEKAAKEAEMLYYNEYLIIKLTQLCNFGKKIIPYGHLKSHA
jgi:hypothetical protein